MVVLLRLSSRACEVHGKEWSYGACESGSGIGCSEPAQDSPAEKHGILFVARSSCWDSRKTFARPALVPRGHPHGCDELVGGRGPCGSGVEDSRNGYKPCGPCVSLACVVPSGFGSARRRRGLGKVQDAGTRKVTAVNGQRGQRWFVRQGESSGGQEVFGDRCAWGSAHSL